ncbi:hypothetical protein B0G81_6802 [Paraburkholderia sp. BL6665CI2N2]|nr:hypothetical protein B0G81_6802 [Paraburkholderia sp. BL6665CI2N2]
MSGVRRSTTQAGEAMPDIPSAIPAAVMQAAMQQAQPNLADAAKQSGGKKKKPAGKTAAQTMYPSLPSAQDVGAVS